jgi:hypothetical protein
MSEFVRGSGDVGRRRGGIAWSVAGGGGLTVEDGRASLTGADAVSGGSEDPWRFETSLDAELLAGAAILRQIAVQAADGATLVCTAVGTPGIAGHGEERARGVMRAGDEEIDYEEALISTQYDGSGDPTRFSLELWPAEADQSVRAAATRVSASLLGGARSGAVWAGLFRCHTDGAEGIGAYLLWRP